MVEATDERTAFLKDAIRGEEGWKAAYFIIYLPQVAY